MTREEAIKILSPNSESRLVRSIDGFLPTKKVLSALEMACCALRSQQATAKLDRNRWEGCFICKGATYLDGDICVSGMYEERGSKWLKY